MSNSASIFTLPVNPPTHNVLEWQYLEVTEEQPGPKEDGRFYEFLMRINGVFLKHHEGLARKAASAMGWAPTSLKSEGEAQDLKLLCFWSTFSSIAFLDVPLREEVKALWTIETNRRKSINRAMPTFETFMAYYSWNFSAWMLRECMSKN